MTAPPLKPVTLTVTYQANGEPEEHETPERLWMCLADRVAWERRFMASVSDLRVGMASGTAPDDWGSFFVYRALAREGAKTPGGQSVSELGFDAWVETLEDIAIGDPNTYGDQPPADGVPPPEGEAPDPPEATGG